MPVDISNRMISGVFFPVTPALIPTVSGLRVVAAFVARFLNELAELLYRYTGKANVKGGDVVQVAGFFVVICVAVVISAAHPEPAARNQDKLGCVFGVFKIPRNRCAHLITFFS